MSMRRSLFWSYGSQATNLITAFATSVIVARLLSPHQFGTFAFAMALMGFVSVFTSLNLSSFIVREGGLSSDKIRALFTLNAMATLSLSTLILLVATYEWKISHENDVAIVLAMSSIAPLIGIFEFVPSALFQREMDFGVLSVVGVARTAVSSIITIILASLGLGAVSLAVGPIFGTLLSATFYNIRRREDIILLPTRHGLKPAFVFGMQIMSISGVAQMTQRLSDIGLGRILGLSALGLYSRASNLAGMVFANIYGQATSVVFVRMSKDLRETGSLHITFLLSMRMITAAIWPLIIGIAVLARPLIHTIYGVKWDQSANPLAILMLAQFVALGFGMNWELFVLRHETALQTRFEFIRAIAGLGLFIVGCFFSITAAATGRLAEVIVGYCLYRPHIDRLAGTKAGELERVFVESLTLTFVAVLPAFVLMTVNRWAYDVSPILVVTSVLVGVIAWCSALWRRKHPIYNEVVFLFNKVRPKRGEAAG